MNTIKNLALGIALGLLLAAAAALLALSRSAPLARPVWTPVDGAGEHQSLTHEQLLQGSGFLWQIYAQGYRDGQAHARAPGTASSASPRR